MSPPAWLHTLASVSLAIALACALWALYDLRRRPQPMAIMNPVWPITMLWAGPLGLLAYLWFGRATPHQQHHGHDHAGAPGWQSAIKGATHCGAGCTLGDLIAELCVLLVPLSLFGEAVFGTWALDLCLAFALGIVFQYFSIKPMRQLSPGQALVAAVKADTLSLLAWQLGMYGWMAISLFVLFSEQSLPKSGPVFWFMMQLAMLLGLLCALPVNAWLIRRGIKEAM